MVNKNGDITLTTVLLMVLGIVVVVLLIWGFSTGWSGFWERISPFGRNTNVDTIRSACSMDCNSGDPSNFCSDVKELRMADGRKFKGSCKTLSQHVSEAGIVACSVDCSQVVPPKKCDGNWKPGSCGDKPDLTNSVGDTEGHDLSKEKCCSKS